MNYLNINDYTCPEGYITAIDFIQKTGINIDIVQNLIKYHRLDGKYIGKEFFICEYEADYFKDYNNTHKNTL